MGLRELVLATMVSALPVSVRAEEPQTTVEVYRDQTTTTDRSAERTRLGLGLKYGYTKGNDRLFARKEASLDINGYLISLRFLKEDDEREEADTIEVANVKLAGMRRYQTHQANVGFGYELSRFRWQYAEAALYGHVTGGIQLDTNYLQLEGEKIPGKPEIDFLLGAGVLTELNHPLVWTQIPFVENVDVGLGVTAEYLSEQVEIQKPEEGLYYGIYGLVRIGKK